MSGRIIQGEKEGRSNKWREVGEEDAVQGPLVGIGATMESNSQDKKKAQDVSESGSSCCVFGVDMFGYKCDIESDGCWIGLYNRYLTCVLEYGMEWSVAAELWNQTTKQGCCRLYAGVIYVDSLMVLMDKDKAAEVLCGLLDKYVQYWENSLTPDELQMLIRTFVVVGEWGDGRRPQETCDKKDKKKEDVRRGGLDGWLDVLYGYNEGCCGSNMQERRGFDGGKKKGADGQLRSATDIKEYSINRGLENERVADDVERGRKWPCSGMNLSGMSRIGLYLLSMKSWVIHGDAYSAGMYMDMVMDRWPRDMYALKRAQVFYFFSGNIHKIVTPTLLPAVVEQNRGKPYYYGMLSFALEQRNRPGCSKLRTQQETTDRKSNRDNNSDNNNHVIKVSGTSDVDGSRMEVGGFDLWADQLLHDPKISDATKSLLASYEGLRISREWLTMGGDVWSEHALLHALHYDCNLQVAIQDVVKAHGRNDWWLTRQSFMASHNWWHICALLLDRDRLQECMYMWRMYVYKDRRYSEVQMGSLGLLLSVYIRNKWNRRFHDICQNHNCNDDVENTGSSSSSLSSNGRGLPSYLVDTNDVLAVLRDVVDIILKGGYSNGTRSGIRPTRTPPAPYPHWAPIFDCLLAAAMGVCGYRVSGLIESIVELTSTEKVVVSVGGENSERRKRVETEANCDVSRPQFLKCWREVATATAVWGCRQRRMNSELLGKDELEDEFGEEIDRGDDIRCLSNYIKNECLRNEEGGCCNYNCFLTTLVASSEQGDVIRAMYVDGVVEGKVGRNRDRINGEEIVEEDTVFCCGVCDLYVQRQLDSHDRAHRVPHIHVARLLLDYQTKADDTTGDGSSQMVYACMKKVNAIRQLSAVELWFVKEWMRENSEEGGGAGCSLPDLHHLCEK
eukprot:GHVS01077735.1.p1 GENE.GHVS01077735.1~~GHVS01077735.1.p1  ORF type:complete len:901 (+),score=145.69 GHVS01077735.1:119-2821(+)